MSTYNIRAEDIKKFETLVRDLDKLVKKIREYEPSAHLWVTPSHVNLMTGYGSCVGEGKLEKEGEAELYALESDMDNDAIWWVRNNT